MEIRDNKQLIDELKKGSRAAWEYLVDSYLNLVYAVIKKTLFSYGVRGNEQDVEDLAYGIFQTICKDGYKVLDTLREPYDIKSWLVVCAKRRAIDFLRARRVNIYSIHEAKYEGEEYSESIAAPEVQEETATEENSERTKAIEEALTCLSDKEALLVRLVYFQNKKYKETARIMGINMNSISPTLMRALAKMKKFLDSKGISLG